MRFINSVVLGMILSAPLFTVAGGRDYDLEQIKTVYGRVYHEISILEADGYGLTFRHREGVAKLNFSLLPANLRMLYEVVEEFGKEAGQPIEKEDSTKTGTESAPGGYPALPIVFTVRTRVTVPSLSFPVGGGYCNPASRYLPGWWSRYQPAHQLANPCYRELALRDFLYTSGLVPRPFGIRTYRLPWGSSSHFY